MTSGRDCRETSEADAPPSPSEAGTAASPTRTFNASADTSGLAGSNIGSYKLLRILGEGGMGVVYEAEQKEPVRRRVALKIIKPGMDSSQVVARFDAERQALALMDHPNIARVLDGGATQEARPYFVMELVKGMPISKYCDERRAGVEARLRLFLLVCHAVQHAHQKGVVHRDLKPSNVLVMEIDGQAIPKVIDFGLAKALHQPLTERTMFTGIGAFVGTLEYMSPEQAGQNVLDIDTRTDVYSLGVLLYKLLTGTTPLDGGRLRAMPFDEVVATLRQFEPPPPSVRLIALDADLPAAAHVCGADAGQLVSQVRGELDWIVCRALEKDRNRRYPTVDALAADVARHLSGEPVEASPPSATYRLRKLARKYRKALATAAAMAALIVAALVASLWQWGRAKSAETELTRQLESNERAERKFKELGILLVDGMDGRERADAESRESVREDWLRDMERTLAEDVAEGPLEPFLRHFIGVMVRDSDAALAERHLRASLARLDEIEPASDDTMAVRNSLAMHLADGKKFDESLALHERNVTLAKSARPFDEAKLLLCEANAANAYLIAGRADDALPHVKTALDLARSAKPREVRAAISCVNRLAKSLAKEKRLPTQLLLLAAANDLSRRLGTDYQRHPVALRALNNLASGRFLNREYATAIPLLEEALHLRQQHLGRSHPDTLSSMNQLAMARLAVDDGEGGLELLRELLRRREVSFGAANPETFSAARTVVQVQSSLRRLTEAETLLTSILRDYDAMTADERKNMRPYVDLLVAVYEKAENEGKAKMWRGKLAK